MTRVLCLLVAWSMAAPAPTIVSIRGFSSDDAVKQHALERKARATPEPARLREYMRAMTEEPHIAGSPQSRKVAEYALGLFRSFGLNAELEEFEALLPYPTARQLELVGPVPYKARLEEPRLPEDRASRHPGHMPTYNSYAATGDVTAPLVYVNYGVPADYEELRGLGIDVKGKIVIARYGQSWRGTKAKVAQENGAIGCLIYSDPRDDGYFAGDVYPRGPFRPQHGVQRGSVVDLPVLPGDPLSPGWASVRGSRRLPREEAGSIMKIPVLPISYGDAEPLLAALGGPVAPLPWRGALPLTYHVGPGPASVRLRLDFDWTSKPMYNVMATIRGSVWPDEWILYGNHHDAWNNGAHDPISGAIAVLETGRALGELLKTGWRPKRTIVLALWDGEEFGLMGSTEYVEKHVATLKRNAILYLNSDSSGTGHLNAAGSPALQTFFAEVLRDVRQPGSEKSLLEARPERQGKPVPFALAPVGAGSDYVAFLHHAGIASINAGFSGGNGSGGIYHSVYDSFDWYTRFSDKDFVHGRALTQVMTTAILRLSEAGTLPFDFNPVVSAVNEWITDLPGADTAPVRSSLDRLRRAAEIWNESFRPDAAAANAELIGTERMLLHEPGLPGRPWYKHQLMAPGLYTGYSAKTLPAIRDAKDPQAGVPLVADALDRYAQAVERAATRVNAR
ncbi:MAG TPA: M28 family peptidase [Bryobacteraceae bacterium]|nr:M28 family peptidase [Bryobacteraceae bacterium]